MIQKCCTNLKLSAMRKLIISTINKSHKCNKERYQQVWGLEEDAQKIKTTNNKYKGYRFQ